MSKSLILVVASSKAHDRNYSRAFTSCHWLLASTTRHLCVHSDSCVPWVLKDNLQVFFEICRGTKKNTRAIVNLAVGGTVAGYTVRVDKCLSCEGNMLNWLVDRLLYCRCRSNCASLSIPAALGRCLRRVNGCKLDLNSSLSQLYSKIAESNALIDLGSKSIRW